MQQFFQYRCLRSEVQEDLARARLHIGPANTEEHFKEESSSSQEGIEGEEQSTRLCLGM